MMEQENYGYNVLKSFISFVVSNTLGMRGINLSKISEFKFHF